MNTGVRKIYFSMWQQVAALRKWNARDESQRRRVTLECMQLVRGPAIDGTSHSAFGQDETTALLCYLDFLAHPGDLNRAARWVDCQQDYRAYNRARQADWHERKMFGGRKNKLARDRFGGQASAAGEPLDKFDPDEIRKRHMTMASRHQRKVREEGHVKTVRPAGENNNPF